MVSVCGEEPGNKANLRFSSRDRLDNLRNLSMTVVVSWIIVEMAHFLE